MSKRDAEGFLVPNFPAKKQRIEGPTDEEIDFSDIDPSLLDNLDEFLDTADDVSDFDSSSLKKICLQFEKAINTNQQLRLKYAKTPHKFMQSELDLDNKIKELTALAVSPQLYADFIAIGSLTSLISLLNHENADIANDVVSLLTDLFEPFIMTEFKGAICLVESFLENTGVDFLIAHMKRLDEKVPEEATGVYNTLCIIDNLTEVFPKAREIMIKSPALVSFLLDKVKISPVESNKSYASEILSILLTGNGVTELLKNSNVLERLLMLLAPYRKKDPESSVEQETVENIFVCVGAAVNDKENHKLFQELEGIQLMLIFVKKGMFCKHSALKVLDYQLNSDPEMCTRFVELLGLKTLFAAFMKKKKKKSKKYHQSETEDEEHILAIIVSLLLHTNGTDLQRTLHKFNEGDYAKVERLTELYEKNVTRTAECEKKVQETVKEREVLYEDYDAKEDEAEFDLLRLGSGLYALQMTGIILSFVYVLSEGTTKEKITDQLSMSNFSLLHIYSVVSEYLESIEQESLEYDRLRKAAAELYLLTLPKNE